MKRIFLLITVVAALYSTSNGAANKDTALVLVDFENEWTMQQSPFYLGTLDTLLTKTNSLIDYCLKKGFKRVYIRHVEKKSTTAFAPNSKNVELIPTLHKQKTDPLITKYKISPFYNTDLEKELKGMKHLIICGILTNLCVRSTISDAYDREYGITVVKDCCQSYDTLSHSFTLTDLKTTRPEIQFVSLSEIVK
ncbi:MAG: cysteine hydrolase [Chitinivibrionales bacterium]|nr:cysteine hydrolase [Chitinivibrionales bacterium]